MAIKLIYGVFLVLHGLVHLLYFGQSARLFELQPGLTWPDGSWGFSNLLGVSGTRILAQGLCILAGAGLIMGAFGIFTGQSWWSTVVVISAAFSGISFILLWNGRMQQLPNQGAIGLLIDVAIILSILVFRWPQLSY